MSTPDQPQHPERLPSTPKHGQEAKKGYARNPRRKWDQQPRRSTCSRCDGSGVYSRAGTIYLCPCGG